MLISAAPRIPPLPLIFATVPYVVLLVLSDTPIPDNPLMINYIIVKVKVLIKKNNSSKVQILKKNDLSSLTKYIYFVTIHLC